MQDALTLARITLIVLCIIALPTACNAFVDGAYSIKRINIVCRP